jgi:hypothetical protein
LLILGIMKRRTHTASPRLLSSNELRAATGGGMFSAIISAVKDAVGGGSTGDPPEQYMTVELKNTQVTSY